MKSKLKIFLAFLSILLVVFMLYLFIPKVEVIASGAVKNYGSSNLSSADIKVAEIDDNVKSSAYLYQTVKAIVELILFFGSILLFIVGLIIYLRKNNKIKFEIDQLNQKRIGENSDTPKDIEELLTEQRKNKNKFTFCIMIAIIMFLINGIMNITHTFDKPMIYLYPEKEQSISVTLGHPEKLTCVYPAYQESWEVLAQPNGDLTDLKTNRKLYALYWEGISDTKTSKLIEGFCVKGEDVAEFLEEKLAVLGLTEREAEEFIVYWLPKLEKNKYNLIRFETMEEIEENMPLQIEPKPDTIIRVMMEVKSSNRYVNIPKQKLVTPERNGFVAVEWGGTEIK